MAGEDTRRTDNLLRCVDCDEVMSPEDRLAGLWLIDRWCIECVKAEDVRSLRDDTFKDTAITFRVPRYLIPAEEWKEEAQFEQFDKIMADLVKKEGDKNG